MGQNQSGMGPMGGGDQKKDKKEKKKWQPPAPPTRVGKKVKKKGLDGQNRLPNVTPASKCMLRKLKLERVKDWLLMEEEFVANQERIKPHTERAEEERAKVDDLRGSPMSVGSLEEIIDDKYVTSHRVVLVVTSPTSGSRPRARRSCANTLGRRALLLFFAFDSARSRSKKKKKKTRLFQISSPPPASLHTAPPSSSSLSFPLLGG